MKKHYTYVLQLVLLALFSGTSFHTNAASHSIIDPDNALYQLEWSFIKTLIDEDMERSFERRDVEFRAITFCTPDLTVNVDTGTCSAAGVTFALPTTDIPGYSMTQSSALGYNSTFPLGDTTVTYTETDDAGILPNGDSCSFTVTVVDNEPPVTPTLASVTVDCNGTLTAPTTTDACAGTITGTTTDTLSFVEGGSTTITWTFADGNGNSTTATQVYNYDDTTPPVTPTLASVTVDCNGTLTAPTTTDACAGTITGTTTDTLSFVEGGSTTITWTFADGNGNSTTATQVYNYDDTTPPVTPTLASVTVDCNGTLTAPTTTDACAGTITGTTTDTLSFVEGGSTTITWTFADGNGNSTTATQIYNYDDTTPPVTPTLASVTVDCEGTLTAPTTTDACAGTITGTTTDTLSFVEGGSTTITWTFADGNGNSTTATQVYNYDDTTPPVTPTLAPVTVDCDGILIAPITTDNCAGVLTGTTTDVLNFVDGTNTTINWEFDDGNGNIINIPQTYNYKDTTDPTANCQNITIYLDVNGEATINASDLDNGSTDNCGSLSFSASQTTFTCADLGDNDVSFIVSDGHGQTDTCIATVTVVDNIAPTAICQNITVQLDASGNATISAADIDNGSSDNCGDVTLTASQTNFDCSNIGTNNVTLTVEDGIGNISTCVAVVTVEDNIFPSAPNPDPINVECSSLVPLPDETVVAPTDNCSTTVTHISDVSNGSSNPEVITRTYRVNDVGGNHIDVTQQITVTYNLTPSIPNDFNVSTCNGETAVVSPVDGTNGNIIPSGTTYSWGLPTLSTPGSITGATALSNQTNFSQDLTNNTSNPETATYVVTARLGTATCSETTFAVVVTVNPTLTPIATSSNPQTICSGQPITPILLSNTNNVPGTTYSWTRTNTTNIIGIADDTGTSISGVLINNTALPQTTTFNIVASANGCVSASPITVSITVRPTPVVVATPETLEICSGESATVNLSNGLPISGPTTYSWTRTNIGNITGPNSQTGITAPLTVTLTNTTTTTQTTTFAITATTGGCTSLEKYVTVTVFAPLRGPFLIGDTQELCNRRNPTDLSILTPPTGGSGNFNYRWEVSVNGTTGWTNTGSNQPTHSPSNNNRYYRLIISDPLCTTNSIISDNTVSINYIGEPGGIFGNLNISNPPSTAAYCPGATIEPEYDITHTTLSNVDFIYVANSAYVNPSSGKINGTRIVNNLIYRQTEGSIQFSLQNNGNTTVTTQISITPEYEVFKWYGPYDYTCVGNPRTMNVTIHPTPKATSTFVNNTIICSGTDPQITVNGNITDNDMRFSWTRTTPTGISGGATSGASANITPGSTYIIPGILTNSTNAPIPVTYTITPLSTTTPNCGPGTPITRTVIVAPSVSGGTIAANQVVCSGTIPGAFTGSASPLTGGTVSYQWQVSTDNTNFTAIGGATGQNYSPTSPITAQTFYRRITTHNVNGVSCSGTSNFITISPNSITSGTIANNQTICSGSTPVNLSGTPASGSIGGTNFNYLWESAPSITGPWSSTGVTTSGYTFGGPITSTTYYRRRATATNNGGCSIYSNVVSVFVNQVVISSVSADQLRCSIDTPSPLTVSASGSGILSYQWQSSSNNTGPWTNVGGNQSSYQPPVLNQTTYYRVIVTSTNTIACSTTSSVMTISVNPYIVANAGADINYSTSNCGATSVTLNAQNLNGQWSVTSGQSPATYSFSNVNDRNSTFIGQLDQTYTLQWSVSNAIPCSNTTDTMTVQFANCGNYIDFDGTNDYVDLGNSYNLNGNFSIEIWVKRNMPLGSAQTLISKRDASNLATGYDLRLNSSGVVQFRYDSTGLVQSNIAITDIRWHHIALTFDDAIGTYLIYIDGINVSSLPSTGLAPTANTYNSLIGALGSSNGSPINHFRGALDELRIWDVTLSASQIREMMNQEIENNGLVRGSIIGLDIMGLNWSNLNGYYQMNQTPRFTGDIPDIVSGELIANVGVNGRLRNMTTNQVETAPLPYISVNNGNWATNNTWLNGSVQVTPNTNSMNWNIVRTQHNISSGNRATTLLGLLVGNGSRVSITNDQVLYVDKYLKIDGVLDLVGESQLLQPEGSIVDYTGTGALERDQQGTGNMFNYNYWGSPVSTGGTATNRTYTLRDILFDGDVDVSVNWIAPHTFTPSIAPSPISISTRWLYTYKGDANDYDVWNRINPDTPIQAGVGYLMKGGGVNTAPDKNYTFKGQPNNGTIIVPIGSGPDQAIVIGNPYPSAIDSKLFIEENELVLLDEGGAGGSLQFWQQSPNAATHILAEYQGGYGYLNIIGGLPPVSPPGYDVGDATTAPERYIPVGQGFYVNAGESGGDITFKNSQRVFEKESDGESVFLRTPEGESKTAQGKTPSVDDIQRVRLAFKTPEGASRHLLLGFTPDNAATDGIDYGYDGLNGDEFPSDLTFSIEGKQFVIQGVGAFDINKKYPLDMTLKIPGNVELSLTGLENFEEPIDVYVHDALLDTYTRINTVSFQTNLEAGNYNGRFSIVFRPDSTLSTIDQDFKDISVKYLQKTDEIYVKTPASIEVRQVYLVNMAGQAVRSWNMTNMNFAQEFKIPVKNISEGNYVLKVETNTNSYNKKVIIKF